MLSYWKKWLLIGVLLVVIVLTLFCVMLMTSKKGGWLYYQIYNIFPSVAQTAYPWVWIHVISYGPPTWEYQMVFPKPFLPESIKTGSTWSIGTVGIESASVSGDAALPEFGAWRVKQITNKGVVFEATRDAEVPRSFGCFSLTVPNAINGEVNWRASTCFDPGLGWGGNSGTISGPVRRENDVRTH
jgi:hypothetical protein